MLAWWKNLSLNGLSHTSAKADREEPAGRQVGAQIAAAICAAHAAFGTILAEGP
ncbi:hypothetical protein D3C87_912660 [compost metagenome]